MEEIVFYALHRQDAGSNGRGTPKTTERNKVLINLHN